MLIPKADRKKIHEVITITFNELLCATTTAENCELQKKAQNHSAHN
jgi:hypothetical protein